MCPASACSGCFCYFLAEVHTLLPEVVANRRGASWCPSVAPCLGRRCSGVIVKEASSGTPKNSQPTLPLDRIRIFPPSTDSILPLTWKSDPVISLLCTAAPATPSSSRVNQGNPVDYSKNSDLTTLDLERNTICAQPFLQIKNGIFRHPEPPGSDRVQVGQEEEG